MLHKFYCDFDYADFEKKCKHYFSISSPIYADITLTCGGVYITSLSSKKTIYYEMSSKLTVKENMHEVINKCIEDLYPRMLAVVQVPLILTKEQKVQFALQGLTAEQITKKELKNIYKWYTITRLNPRTDTIYYKEISTNKIFYLRLKFPLPFYRAKLSKLTVDSEAGARDLYDFIVGNSEVQEYV